MYNLVRTRLAFFFSGVRDGKNDPPNIDPLCDMWIQYVGTYRLVHENTPGTASSINIIISLAIRQCAAWLILIAAYWIHLLVCTSIARIDIFCPLQYVRRRVIELLTYRYLFLWPIRVSERFAQQGYCFTDKKEQGGEGTTDPHRWRGDGAWVQLRI